MLALILVIMLILTPGFASAQDLIITDIKGSNTPEGFEVLITGSADLEHRLLQYVNPSKVILEFPGTSLKEGVKTPELGDPAVQRVRLSETGTGVKLALDLEYSIPRAEVRRGPQGLSLLVPTLFEETNSIRVSPGVVYKQITRGTPTGPLEINVLEFDRKESEVKIATALAQEHTLGREPLSAITKRKGAIAAVNASYFAPDGTPLGLYIEEGRLVTEPILHRTALAITSQGELLIMPFDFAGALHLGKEKLKVSGLNRQRYQDELIIYTSDRGTTTRTNRFGFELVVREGKVVAKVEGDAPIPADGFVVSGHGVYKDILKSIELGTECTLDLNTEPDWEKLQVEYAVGAGPLLVKDGQVSLTTAEESFKPDIAQGKAPRSAIGLTRSGKIVVVTVNGRNQGISIGMTLEELAELMVELGCDKALNLDGGGSATMVIRNRPLNMPSDGQERQVSSALLFFVDEEKESF